MKTTSRARTFSSFGKVSRTALIGAGAVAGLLALTAVVAARASTADAPGASVDAARHVLSAAESWQGDHGDGCPTISQLIEDGQLEETIRTDDAWGNRFRIVCEGADLKVHSAGPDRRAGTADDVSIGHSS
jgi:hypothetical protein